MTFDRRQVQRIEQTLNFIAVAASAYLVIRVLAGPDSITRARMATHLTIARAANKTGSAFNELALSQMSKYHKCRNVTA